MNAYITIVMMTVTCGQYDPSDRHRQEHDHAGQQELPEVEPGVDVVAHQRLLGCLLPRAHGPHPVGAGLPGALGAWPVSG